MAAMFAYSSYAAETKLNLSAYEDVESEDTQMPEEPLFCGDRDDQSTRASSGGSEHASSSGSEDESTGTISKRTSVVKAKLATTLKKQATLSADAAVFIPASPPLRYEEPEPVLCFPPGLEPPPSFMPPFSAPPGLEYLGQPLSEALQEVQPPVAAMPYSRKAFRKQMVGIFNDIRQARTASLNGAVRRIREQNVPKDEQPALFSEMMTRAVEEMSGPGRRLCMALVTGVAAGAPSAFDKDACLAGVKIFFQDVYDGLMDEVPKLPIRVEREFLPVLRTAFNVRELNEALPARLRMAP